MNSRMNALPEITKNLIVINVLMYLATMAFPNETMHLAMYPVQNETAFQPFQIVTHMFMHGGIGHLFFNMLGLYMFGGDIERVFGPKRYLFFYLSTGLGAAFMHMGVQYWEINQLVQEVNTNFPPDMLEGVFEKGTQVLQSGKNYTDETLGNLNIMLNTPVVGASGALYGLLAAFGMLYPNRMIMLLIPPIPMKAKYFALIFGGYALFAGVNGIQPGVAHFAHLGGALLGALTILLWRKQGVRF